MDGWMYGWMYGWMDGEHINLNNNDYWGFTKSPFPC
jgi:hypothetical protein